MATDSQVFYRKWRPKCFGEVVGQQHIVDTLKRSVASGRVAHAYLFTGPRGVGKTSTARILAKALNCLNQKDGDADNQCEQCKAVEESRMIDLIELDAASNRGIDSIRGLRESTTFQPVAGSWKIYIIDEVHMLTEEAFNALLKTLEEPPQGIVMILATTDAHKVPATIISRCQRFDFERLTHDVIKERLIALCEAENIKCAPTALDTIVTSAWGSLRDAENALEQLALGQKDKEISAEDAAKLLGLGNRQAAIELSAALINKDIKVALEKVTDEVSRGISPQAVQKGTIDVLRTALLVEAGVKHLSESDPALVELANSIKTDETKRHLAQVLRELSAVKFKGEMVPSVPLELAVLKICVAPTPPAESPPIARATPTTNRAPARQYAPSAPRQHRPTAPQPSMPAPAPAPSSAAKANLDKLCDIIRRSSSGTARLTSIISNIEPPAPQDGTLPLRFKSNALYKKFQDETKAAEVRQILRKAVDEVYGAGLQMKAAFPTNNSATAPTGTPGTEADAKPVVEDNATVRYLVTMGAKVLEHKKSEESAVSATAPAPADAPTNSTADDETAPLIPANDADKAAETAAPATDDNSTEEAPTKAAKES